MTPKSLDYSDLIASIRTTQNVTNFLSEIDTFIQTLYRSENGSLEKALSQINTGSAEKITQAFAKNSLDINNKSEVIGYFENLKIFIKNLRIIKLIVAFDPFQKTIEKIHNYVNDLIGTGYVLDIETSGNVLGGAVVIFNGKYKDFTLKKSLEDTFTNKNIRELYQ